MYEYGTIETTTTAGALGQEVQAAPIVQSMNYEHQSVTVHILPIDDLIHVCAVAELLSGASSLYSSVIMKYAYVLNVLRRPSFCSCICARDLQTTAFAR